MFRCKPCGRKFGANIPEKCPDCGTATPQPTDARRVSALLAIESLGCLASVILFGLAVTGVVALVFWLR